MNQTWYVDGQGRIWKEESVGRECKQGLTLKGKVQDFQTGRLGRLGLLGIGRRWIKVPTRSSGCSGCIGKRGNAVCRKLPAPCGGAVFAPLHRLPRYWKDKVKTLDVDVDLKMP